MESQQKTTYLIAAIAVLAVIGGYVFLRSPQQGQEASSISAKESQVGSVSGEFTKGETSFKQLLLSSVPQKCIISSVDPGGNNTGQVYTSSGMMRGDFVSESRDQKGATVMIQSHMIVRDAMSYVWADKEKIGMSMKINTSAATGTQSGGSDLDQKANVDCSAWVPDETLFVIPQDVKFQSIEDMMKEMMPAQKTIPQGGKMETQ